MSERAFAELLAGAPYPIPEETRGHACSSLSRQPLQASVATASWSAQSTFRPSLPRRSSTAVRESTCGAADQRMRPVEAWSELTSQLFECVDVIACAVRRGECSHWRRGPIRDVDSHECLDCGFVLVSDG